MIGLFCGRCVLAAVAKSEFGVYGVVGGMTVITLLAYTLRSVRGGSAVDDEYAANIYSKTYTEGSDTFEPNIY